eukprot:818662-Pyramimonas_sp.AAC.1
MGRGTVQGDTLSPLLFILFVEPLLKWLRKGELHYQFATSEATVGPLAYADDLAVVTNTVSQMHSQAKKIETFCKWAGLQ